jgi:hypothetical protein
VEPEAEAAAGPGAVRPSSLPERYSARRRMRRPGRAARPVRTRRSARACRPATARPESDGRFVSVPPPSLSSCRRVEASTHFFRPKPRAGATRIPRSPPASRVPLTVAHQAGEPVPVFEVVRHPDSRTARFSLAGGGSSYSRPPPLLSPHLSSPCSSSTPLLSIAGARMSPKLGTGMERPNCDSLNWRQCLQRLDQYGSDSLLVGTRSGL